MPPAARVRGRVLAFAFLLAVVTYLDRICISAATPYIMEDLHLTVLQMSVVFSAFTLAYSLFEIPSGWLGDVRGPRRVLTRIVLWWSAFTMLTGAARGFASLVSIRFLFGAGEAGAFPNIARSFSRWFPRRERGRANGVMFLGSRLGGMLSAPLALLLVTKVGWRASFVTFGTLGIVWAAAWYAWYRDRPEEHSAMTREELAWIRQDTGSEGPGLHTGSEGPGLHTGSEGPGLHTRSEGPGLHTRSEGPGLHTRSEGPGLHAGSEGPGLHTSATPWRALLTSRNLYAICAMYFAFGYGLYFYFTWLPTYLIKVLGFSVFSGGLFASLPFLLAGIADLVGGWTTDVLSRAFGLRVGRCYLGFAAFLSCAGFVFTSTLPVPAIAKAVLLAFALASADLALGACWATPLDIAPDHAGVITGCMNTLGNLGGMVGPLVVGYAVQRWGSWTLAFYVTGAVYVAGALAWLAIDPTRPLAASAPATT